MYHTLNAMINFSVRLALLGTMVAAMFCGAVLMVNQPLWGLVVAVGGALGALLLMTVYERTLK